MFVIVGVGTTTSGYSQTLDPPAGGGVQKDTITATPSSGNEKVIAGQVLSKNDNSPISGVVVFVKGTNIATETDESGNYSISVPQEHANGTLVIKYEDETTVELPLATTTNFTVLREEDVTKLETVQIIGYGTQEKSDVTGSISSVKSEELNRVTVTDPTLAMQGRATGINVTQNTGAPGSPITIRIRGIATIGNADPLYVVNGVPVDNIAFLNSNDIQSIDVLKDASSCAVYGARGANGVVLVTTKAGSKKKSGFNFNYLTGQSEAWKKMNLLDASEYALLTNEAGMAKNGTIKYADPASFGKGTDWQDLIFRKAKMNSYNLSANGSTEKSNYYVSGSYLSQEGIIQNSGYERYNFLANADYQASKRLKVGSFVNMAFYKRTALYDSDPYNSVVATTLQMDPITQPYSGRGGDSLYASGVDRTDKPNPLAYLKTRSNVDKGLNIMGRWFAEYELIKGLKFKSTLGYVYGSNTNSGYIGRYLMLDDAKNVVAKQSNEVSTVSRNQGLNTQVLFENSLNYEKTFAQKHKIGVLALVGTQSNKGEGFAASKQKTVSNDPSQQHLDAALTDSTRTATGGKEEYSLMSYLGRINYEYDNKYLFTANMRADASSRFPEKSRWGSFPSFAAGWKISEEGFFAPLKKNISFLKLRASWGKLGNQNIPGGNYPYTTNIANEQNYAIKNSLATGKAPLGAGNPDIKWENVTTSNIALDFGFFKDKLLFSADYFTRLTSDMLTRKSLPAYSGVQEFPYVNLGKIRNRGIELSLEYRNEETKFKYSVKGNMTMIKNKVLEMGDPLYEGQYRIFTTNLTKEGLSVAEFYGYQVDGVIQTEEEAAKIRATGGTMSQAQAGDLKFKDVNGDGTITDKDRTTLGSPLPKIYYGISGAAQYGSFDVNITFQGVGGNKIFNGSSFNLLGGDPNSNMSVEMLNRWTGTGSSFTMPRMAAGDPNNNARMSSRYIENGSYLRIKNLQIGYTVPEKFTQKVKFQKFRVYVAAQNLLTFTKYTGLDPEIGTYNYGNSTSSLNMGVDAGGTYPQARTWQFGINASF